MKTKEFLHDIPVEGFSMSGNPLVASDLLLNDHNTRYGCHFSKLKCPTQI